MARLLGIDTGGTYTDAVLYDDTSGVIAKAKSLTTKQDLSQGVGRAMAQVLPEGGPPIQLVSLSTTLATNALVEGHGGPVGLLLLGYPKKALTRSKLAEALGQDPMAMIAGGHTADGEPQAPLDLDALRAAAQEMMPKVSAFAVAGFFAVRNPAHELAARDLLRGETGLPVTCAHALSAGLDAPRRALTALLNARLIPLIQHLIEAVQGLMAKSRLDVPLMVVKGDGSLVSDKVALAAPVETILSGPAASLVGARALAQLSDVLVSDIGGTTTDIALLRDGRPLLSPSGATVGGFRTMVEAIAVHTLGLGGDSEVKAASGGRFSLGPRRAVPLSLLAEQHPAVLEVMQRQAETAFAHPNDGRFLLRLRALPAQASLRPAEAAVWEALAGGPQPLEVVAKDYLAQRACQRLADRGLVINAAFTPSDAAHLLGRQAIWDPAGATQGGRLLARQLGLQGPEAVAEAVVSEVAAASAEALVLAALAEEGMADLPSGGFGRALLDRAVGRAADLPPAVRKVPGPSLLRPQLSLTLPLVGIGAPAATYYPEIAKRLDTQAVLPEHAEVCNAVGAVASGVIQRHRVVITQLADGRYRAHLPEGVEDFLALDRAAEAAAAAAGRRVRFLAEEAGAEAPQIEIERDDTIVPDGNGQETFVESQVTATAIGRPRLAAS
ncbi:MAG: hydantoinase/oxoprolinase family protein [Pseudomonadota bacterium]